MEDSPENGPEIITVVERHTESSGTGIIVAGSSQTESSPDTTLGRSAQTYAHLIGTADYRPTSSEHT